MRRFLKEILLTARDRSAVRRNVRVPCTISAGDGHDAVTTECLDISADGMRIAAAQELPLGSRLQVALTLPETETKVRVEASVQRVGRGRRRGERAMELGLRFLDCSVVDGAILDASLNGLPPPVPARRLRMDYAASVLRIAREAHAAPAAWA